MAHAGYSTQVSISGTSTAFVDAALEDVTGLGGSLYRIVDATKRTLDPLVPVVVKQDGSPLVAGFSVDYLHGYVTFDNPDGTLTISGAFLPQLVIAEAKGVSISATRDNLDSSTFGTVAKTHIGGMSSADVTLDTLSLLTDDFDPGAATENLQALQDNDTPKVLKVKLPGGRYWAAWCRFPGLNSDAASDALVLSKVTASSIRVTAADGSILSFGLEPIGS